MPKREAPGVADANVVLLKLRNRLAKEKAKVKATERAIVQYEKFKHLLLKIKRDLTK